MRINKKSFLCQTIFYFFILVLFTQCNSKSSLPKGDPNNGGLFLPDGFEAVVVVDSIGSARHLAVNDNGDIYIKLSRSKKGEGNVALRDVDGDARQIQSFTLEIMIMKEVFPIACAFTMVIYIMVRSLLFIAPN